MGFSERNINFVTFSPPPRLILCKHKFSKIIFNNFKQNILDLNNKNAIHLVIYNRLLICFYGNLNIIL